MILVAIILFGASIAFHEFGHFLAMKALGYTVKKFSVGIGPGLSFQRGDTKYSFSPLLIGGYVQKADEGEEGYKAQPPWKDLIVAAAGPIFSLIVGVIFFTAAVTMKANGIWSFLTFFAAYPKTFVEEWPLIYGYIKSVVHNAWNFGSLVHALQTSLMGPLGMVRQASQLNMADCLTYFAFANFSIASFNALPIPPLDGGHVLLSFLEIVTRRKQNALRVVTILFGALALLAVMALATYNDVTRWSSQSSSTDP